MVKQKSIVSTGYNGTPRGARNCNEGGCPRCNDLAPGGTSLGDCLCSHGEENAITQAAYHGVSLRGGTLYTTFSPCLQCTKLIINAEDFVSAMAVGADGRPGQTPTVQALAMDGLGIVGQHAVLGNVRVVADPGALLVAAPAHDGDVELVNAGIRILGRRDVVGSMAGPAARGQGNTLGHAHPVETAGVDVCHVVVAHGAVDLFELLVMVTVEILEVHVAIDTGGTHTMIHSSSSI